MEGRQSLGVEAGQTAQAIGILQEGLGGVGEGLLLVEHDRVGMSREHLAGERGPRAGEADDEQVAEERARLRSRRPAPPVRGIGLPEVRQQPPRQGGACRGLRCRGCAIESSERRIGRGVGGEGLVGAPQLVQGVAEDGGGHASLMGRQGRILQQGPQARLGGGGLAVGDFRHRQRDA